MVVPCSQMVSSVDCVCGKELEDHASERLIRLWTPVKCLHAGQHRQGMEILSRQWSCRRHTLPLSRPRTPYISGVSWLVICPRVVL